MYLVTSHECLKCFKSCVVTFQKLSYLNMCLHNNKRYLYVLSNREANCLIVRGYSGHCIDINRAIHSLLNTGRQLLNSSAS